MVLIYEDSEVSINKKKKNEFEIFIKSWDGKYKKFWVNFPLSLMKLIGKKAVKKTKQKNIPLRQKKWRC